MNICQVSQHYYFCNLVKRLLKKVNKPNSFYCSESTIFVFPAKVLVLPAKDAVLIQSRTLDGNVQ